MSMSTIGVPLEGFGAYCRAAAAAIYAATVVAKRPENKGKNIIIALADNGMKYLSTNMYPLSHKVQ